MSNFSSYIGYKTKNSPQKWFLTVLNHLPLNKLPLVIKDGVSEYLIFLHHQKYKDSYFAYIINYGPKETETHW